MSKKSVEPVAANPIEKVVKSTFVNEFKEFINRGNVVDLAIGVAVGGAFTSIAKSLVDDIVMPIVSLLVGGLDFNSLAIDIPNFFGADSAAHIAYGNFIQNVVNFLVIALALFIMVKAINKFHRHKEKEQKDADDKAKADSAKASSQAAKK